MSKIKSGVTFFRKALNIKGKSVHNGRGAYEMNFDCTMAELETKIEAMMIAHSDKLEIEICDATTTRISIKDEFIIPDNPFVNLYFISNKEHDQHPLLMVTM